MHVNLKTERCCQHCGLAVAGDVVFCCAGCESVHSLLVERGLEHFYTLRDRYSFKKPAPISAGSLSPQEHLLEESSAKKEKFYLEGIHCLGCLWLLEKLPEIDPRILSSSLDFAHQLLEVEIGDQISWPDVSRLIRQLGYSAKPIRADGLAPIRRRDAQRQLARIGVAAFCSGNIMLLSVAVYAGTDPFWSRRFGWLSFALALPVLTYSAWPIYKASFLPLAKGRISVDLAIASALAAGSVMSVWGVVREIPGQVYFDSLSMLVFLLLSSRYLLMKFRESLAKDSNFLTFLAGEKYLRVSPRPGPIKAPDIDIGDEFILMTDQALPVDAVLLDPKSHFDLSLLTGESLPLTFRAGDRIEAGAVLRESSSRLRADRKASESRLALTLEKIRSYQMERSPSLDFADRLGKYFVAASLLGSALLLLLFPGEEGVRRALALVIVTCPCVLAFAVPLAFTRAMQIAARNGILFVTPGKLEELAKVKNIFFDKTGTVTTGNFEVREWRQVGRFGHATKRAALALEGASLHPVGKAITRFCAAEGIGRSPAEAQELSGYGVSGEFEGNSWRIGKSARTAAGQNIVEILANGRLEAEVILGDSVRAGSQMVISSLAKKGITAVILSGDHAENVSKVAASVGISNWHGDLKPEDKARLVGAAKDSAMVGDGANDAIAFQTAGVGIAVQGSIDLGIRNCDIVLTRPGLESLLDARNLSEKAMRVIHLNFTVTLSYNLLAGTLAAMGLMQPLWAAILMPLSAFSVFFLTQWRMKEASP